MSFRKMLADLHPELKKKYDSKQYLLAQKIIGRKLALKINQSKMASLMALSYEKYLEMESGSVDISVEDYEMALEKIASLTREDLDSKSSEINSRFPLHVVKSAESTTDKELLFNNKHVSLMELQSSTRREEQVVKGLEKQLRLIKSLNQSNLDLFFDKESTEPYLLVGEMINIFNEKDTEDIDKHSVKLQELSSNKISLFA